MSQTTSLYNFEVHFSQRSFTGVTVDRLHASFIGATLDDVRPQIDSKASELKNRFPSGGEVSWKLDKVFEVGSTTTPVDPEPEPEGLEEISVDDFDDTIISTLTQDEVETKPRSKRNSNKKTSTSSED